MSNKLNRSYGVWWNSVQEFKPKTLERVLATYKTIHGTYLVVIAQYIPPKTVDGFDFMSDDWDPEDSECTEHDEETDIHYVVEGWWEASLEVEINYHIGEKIEYWSYLPKIELK